MRNFSTFYEAYFEKMYVLTTYMFSYAASTVLYREPVNCGHSMDQYHYRYIQKSSIVVMIYIFISGHIKRGP